jgi:hypothetical protein
MAVGDTKTFGNLIRTVGVSDLRDIINFCGFDCNVSGIAQSISAYVGTTTVSKHMKAALYNRDGVFLGGTEELDTWGDFANSFITFNFNDLKPYVERNKSYYLAIWSETGAGGTSRLLLDSWLWDEIPGNVTYTNNLTYGAWPNHLTHMPGIHIGVRPSIYCTYIATEDDAVITRKNFGGSTTFPEWATTATTNIKNSIVACNFVCPSNGIAKYIVAFLSTDVHNAKCAIYDSDLKLLACSEELTVPYYRFWAFPLLQECRLTMGKTYYLACWGENHVGTSVVRGWNTTTNTTSFVYEMAATYGDWPKQFTGALANPNPYMEFIYCNYIELETPSAWITAPSVPMCFKA